MVTNKIRLIFESIIALPSSQPSNESLQAQGIKTLEKNQNLTVSILALWR